MDEFAALFSQMRWQDVLDIALVSFLIYQVLLLVRGTRAVQMLLGLGVILATLVLGQKLDLYTLTWIINSFLSSLILVIIVLFQTEIRRALTRIGRGPFLGGSAEQGTTLEEVVRAAAAMAAKKTGALIALERTIGLAEYVERGVRLDARVSRELLIALFQTTGPLHDGAVVIVGDKVEAAKVVLPLSGNPDAVVPIGTRHRAAMGLSEETDAVCVVVSEERGQVSVAMGGELTRPLDTPSLRNLLLEVFEVGRKKRPRLFKRSAGGK